MRLMSLVVLVAVLAAGLTIGCAATGTTPTVLSAGTPYQANQGALGLRVEDDPAYAAGNPFRMAAFLLHPIGVFLQVVVEAPYAVATAIYPDLFGLNETEQQYYQMRWGVTPARP